LLEKRIHEVEMLSERYHFAVTLPLIQFWLVFSPIFSSFPKTHTDRGGAWLFLLALLATNFQSTMRTNLKWDHNRDTYLAFWTEPWTPKSCINCYYSVKWKYSKHYLSGNGNLTPSSTR
jgi:hypothetical protein